ncbi:MAG: alpha/beta hydrolase [Acidimicrobiales bacterium]|nr:alpha/beta hydrolase [Acidimicrobiales bacterium]
MTLSEEYGSLLASAQDLGITHGNNIRYSSRNIILRHQRFHFLEWGQPTNPTLVLLHGGNQSAHSWDLVSLHLADRYHIIALDQRGHGDSEWSRDADYSSSAMAADVNALINELAIREATIIGHSMGGMNAMRIALDFPNLNLRFVLVDIAPEMSSEGAKSIRQFVTENREFDDLQDFVASVQKYDPYRSAEHIQRTVKYNLLQRADGKFVSKRDHGQRLASTEQQRLNSDRFRLRDAKKMTGSTLLIRGSNSNILTQEAAHRFCEALPNGTLVTVSDSGHNVHGQNTLGFIEALTDFLSA